MLQVDARVDEMAGIERCKQWDRLSAGLTGVGLDMPMGPHQRSRGAAGYARYKVGE